MSTIHRSPVHPVHRRFQPHRATDRVGAVRTPSNDLVSGMAASLFLGLFVSGVGAARPVVALTELVGAVSTTGPRGLRAAGPGGAVLVSRWEQAGLVEPLEAADTTLRLCPRGSALLDGPFRWERLSRALAMTCS